MEKDTTKSSKAESSSSSSEADSKDSKKNKKAVRIGAAAMGSGTKAEVKADSPAEQQPEKKRSSLWERLMRSDKQKATEVATEKTENVDHETPLEHLSPTEKQAATAELAHDRRIELGDEPQTEGDEQDAAAKHFLANIEAHGDSDLAFQETIDEFGLDVASIYGPEDLPVQPEGAADLAPDNPDVLDDELPPLNAGAGAMPPRRPPVPGYEAGPDEPDEPDDQAQQARFQAAYGGVTHAVEQPQYAPPTPQSPAAKTENNYYYERRAQQRGLLVGAVVGYLIGRRRGRINAEKKLLPVQKKLEKEVKTLQADIFQKEIIIRKKTAEKQKVPLSAPTERLIATVSEAAKPAVIETAATEQKLSPMHIGHALLTRENNANRATEPKVVVEHVPVAENEAVTMSRQELLKTSEKVAINGTTLRQIYETNLINEPELRRIVNEHLRGGDVKKALNIELRDNGINYEHDPALRRLLGGSPAVGGGRATTHDATNPAQKLQPVNVAESPKHVSMTPKPAKSAKKPVRPLLVMAVVIIIILLALYLGHKSN